MSELSLIKLRVLSVAAPVGREEDTTLTEVSLEDTKIGVLPSNLLKI